MENQSRLKLRISRMFRSSFGSCKSRNISDHIERPVFVPHIREHHQLIELFSPPNPSISRPKCSETELFPRRKVSDRNSLLTPPDSAGRNCPHSSPILPLNTFFEFHRSEQNQKQKKPRKKTKNRTTQLMKKGSFESFDNYYDWFSSDDDDFEVDQEDDDETTLFSSKSLSSDSSDSFRRNKARYRRRRATKETDKGLMPLQGKVKGSFAVVKRSSDPYGDFRTSMVEMIVEKQIFGARDLDNLLQTFLSLNSHHHHRIIIEVFTEIWEALFSNPS